MSTVPIRTVAAVVLAIGLATALASCGKKVPLKPPPGSTYPRQYPPPPKTDVVKPDAK
jgi:hypothetical protein